MFPPSGGWQEWSDAAHAASRGGEVRTHVELDGGEIRIPAYHPHRQVSSIRPKTSQPWKLAVSLTHSEGGNARFGRRRRISEAVGL